jgi:hypothetical protein
MEQKQPCKKRPCRICLKWFSPNPRLGDRQQTCSDKECQRKWHAKKCAECNRKNRAYFLEIYLRGRLESLNTGIPEQNQLSNPSSKVKAPLNSLKTGISKQNQLPNPSSKVKGTFRGVSHPNYSCEVVQEVIGAEQLVIIGYIVRQLMRGVQEVIRAQRTDKQKKIRQLPLSSSSRGDSQKPP